jgi:hypothetical protein
VPKTYFEQVPVSVAREVLRRSRGVLKSVRKKPKRPKREDAAQSAFRAMQRVIEVTEGKPQKKAPKRH